jgi:hypothetical protein
MHFIAKFIPITSFTCFENINYSSSGGSLLYMESMVFIIYPHWLTADTMKVELYLVLAASQRGYTINTIECMYSKLPHEDE